MVIQLIVGLGNPGSHYANTRHNVGFWFVDKLATQTKAIFRPESKFLGEICRTSVDVSTISPKKSIETHPCWLLKPTTFMNHSGQSVGAFTNFYKIPPSAILVIHDDLDLPPGTVRLKKGGGHGGHNGLKDLMSHLNSNDFYRLRVGIGHPGQASAVVTYVLNPPQSEQRTMLDIALDKAIEFLPFVVSDQLNHAMQKLHTK